MDKGINELLRSLSQMMKCPRCGRKYQIQNMKFVGRVNAFYVLQFKCEHCNVPVMASILVSELNNLGKKLPRFSDLGEKDLLKFVNTPNIAADDVLDMHEFLKDFNGNFKELIGNA